MASLRFVETDSATVILRSPLLERAGFPHGFSTRLGGVSPPPFDALNLARPETASGEREFEENRRRFLGACGLAGRWLVTSRQVHGAATVDADQLDAGTSPRDADALLSRDPTRVIGVRTADCVAVLVACPRSGAVAAVHAGWRGIVAGVVEQAIDSLRAAGAGPFVAAIGPAISCASYEVGDDVAAGFASRGLTDCVVRTDRLRADCHGAVRTILLRENLLADCIDGQPLCTSSNAAYFYSHRRDGLRSGRMLAAIGARHAQVCAAL